MARKIGGRSSQQQRAGKTSAARTQRRVPVQRTKINNARARRTQRRARYS